MKLYATLNSISQICIYNCRHFLDLHYSMSNIRDGLKYTITGHRSLACIQQQKRLYACK